MKTAVLIHEDGRKTPVFPKNPDVGFERDEIAALIEAEWLEYVAATERKPGSGEIVQTGMLLVRDEEGKLRGRATNQEATEILCDCCGEIGGYVVGKALWVADDLLAKETE